jgi:hypothetical protein
MRACFLGQNVCALGNGFAMLQTPPLPLGLQPESEPCQDGKAKGDGALAGGQGRVIPGWQNKVQAAMAHVAPAEQLEKHIKEAAPDTAEY